ncbi:Protein of unknown function, partial [Gryllus bimaculatus]
EIGRRPTVGLLCSPTKYLPPARHRLNRDKLQAPNWSPDKRASGSPNKGGKKKLHPVTSHGTMDPFISPGVRTGTTGSEGGAERKMDREVEWVVP